MRLPVRLAVRVAGCVLAHEHRMTELARKQAFHTGELGLTKDGDQPPEAAEITNELEAVSANPKPRT